MLRKILLLSVIAVSFCPAARAEDARVPWDMPDHILKFRYFEETRLLEKEAWDTLTPAEQKEKLELAQNPSRERYKEVWQDYSAMTRRWSMEELRSNLDSADPKRLEAISFWLGGEKGRAVETKISALRRLLAKARAGGLEDADIPALNQYLQPDAAAELKFIKTAHDAQESYKKKKGAEWKQSGSGAGLKKLSGTNPAGVTQNALSKFYDGGETSGGASGDDSAALEGIKKGGRVASMKNGPTVKTPTLRHTTPDKLQGTPTEAPGKSDPAKDYDFKFSKIGDSKALAAAQDRAQSEKLAREAQVGVAIATREEHEKITKALRNHSGIGAALPVAYDFVPGGVVSDCVTGSCTDGSGAWGKAVQVVTGTKSPREVGGGYYTKTELFCAGIGDMAGDMDALTFGLTKWIPLPSACNRKNGSQ